MPEIRPDDSPRPPLRRGPLAWGIDIAIGVGLALLLLLILFFAGGGSNFIYIDF